MDLQINRNYFFTTRRHTSQATRAALKQFEFNIIPHPMSHLISLHQILPCIMRCLKGIYLTRDEDTNEAVICWINRTPATCFNDIIKNLFRIRGLFFSKKWLCWKRKCNVLKIKKCTSHCFLHFCITYVYLRYIYDCALLINHPLLIFLILYYTKIT